jgi:FHS family L-fucose permease-like MFS transporter
MPVASLESSFSVSSAPAANENRSAMRILAALFFILGFLTCLNDILVPHLKAIFDLSYAEVMLIQFSFFSAYFIFSLPAGKMVDWFGYKKTMAVGLFTMGLGAFLFIPAASVPSFPLFLAALMVLAAGMTALQVSANPYVAVLGPARTASSRLNLTQAFNSLGTTIAPFLGTLLILSAAPKTIEELRKLPVAQLHAYRLHEAATVKLPYLGLALALLVLGVVISRFKLPVLAVENRALSASAGTQASVWKHRHLVLGAVGIFVYVGAEVSIGSFLVNYLSQPNIGNLSQKVAASYVAFYWGGAMIGRFIGSALLRRLPTGRLLAAAAMTASLLVFASTLSSGHIAMWSIILVGLFNSIMFPSIFTLAINGLGTLTGKGSGVLVAAIVGGAIIPEIQGLLADRIGIHHAFLIPAVCYLYIVFYGIRGSKTAHRDAV